MTARRRALLYAALALCVPLPAFALDGHAEPAAAEPAALSVSVELDRCGVAGARVLCKLDVAYGQIPGATRYTASVSRPDGSVADHGVVEPGGTSLWVAYAGDGEYSVEISVYGRPDEGGKPRLLARERSGETGSDPPRPDGERQQRPGGPERDRPDGTGSPAGDAEPDGEDGACLEDEEDADTMAEWERQRTGEPERRTPGRERAPDSASAPASSSAEPPTDC